MFLTALDQLCHAAYDCLKNGSSLDFLKDEGKCDNQINLKLIISLFTRFKNACKAKYVSNYTITQVWGNLMDCSLCVLTTIVNHFYSQLSDSELNDLLTSVECNTTFGTTLVELYQQYKPDLSKVLLAFNATNSYNRYVQVQWKIEVKVASKYIREQLTPLVILRFQTTNYLGQSTYFDMQCSVADIFHMVNKLGDALRRNNSQHCIKLLRHVK